MTSEHTPRGDTYIIALAGNPNVGKSTVFNALTGLKQHTGNWSGKTVACAEGFYEHKGKSFKIIDLPGTYSLVPASLEEEVARDFLCNENPDITLITADATCLERNLNLVLQVIALGKPTVLCVNLMDEAKKKGIYIDLERLEAFLGIPVIGTEARRGKGLSELKDLLCKIADGKSSPHLEIDITDVDTIYKRAEEICRGCIDILPLPRRNLDFKIDKILTSKAFGIPIMLLLFGGILWLTVVGAGYPSELLSSLLFTLQDKLSAVFMTLNPPLWLHDMLILGIYRTVAWVVAVMLPPMAIFFPLFTLLEDLGLLPRIAFNLDKYFRCAGAHGKQSLTMCMGLGCNACGVTGCRIIDSPRERAIAILTNNFVPCNGRFPTLIAIIAMFFSFGGSFTQAALLLLLIVFSVFITLGVSKALSKTILSGLPSSFTLELPPYRVPQFGKVIVRSVFDRTLFVLGRALSVAVPAGFVIWCLSNINVSGVSIFKICTDFLDPAARIFGLDGTILLAFILALPANEIFFPIILMGYLSGTLLADFSSLSAFREILIANGWTYVTALCTLIFTLVHFPCATTILTIKKETKSVKLTLLAIILPTLCGLVLCGFINLISKII